MTADTTEPHTTGPSMSSRLVAIQLPPTRFEDALHRVWGDGDAVLPLPMNAPDAALARVVAALRPAAVETVGAGGEVVRTDLDDAVPVPDGTALVVATSGSTGQPKGVVLEHAALSASVVASASRLGCEPGDRWLLALPVHHVAGVQVLLRARHLGSVPLVLDRFDPASVAAHPAEHVSLVPTQLVRLLDAGVDLSRFRTILLGGARPDRSLLAAARSAVLHVVVSYGMTETCGGCVYDGYALDGVEVAVDMRGRIRIRGSVLAHGYRQPHGTLAPVVGPDGWFATNDLGRVEAARLEVVGRLDDVIVTGGENVPASAVADALRTHPAVADAAVVGRRDPLWGEALVAVVVPRPGPEPPTLERLRAHVRSRHPPAYAPRALVLVDALPRDAMGKVPRDRLRALAED